MAGTIIGLVVPAVEHLKEYPLGPLVVANIGGAHATAGVVTKTEHSQLCPIRGDVVFGCDRGVLTGLHGVLLRG